MSEEQRFDQADAEVQSVVNSNHERYRREVIARTEYVDIPEEETVAGRWENLKRFGAAAARASVGLVFLGGITRAWIAPAFGLLAAGACFVWAWGYFRSSRRA